MNFHLVVSQSENSSDTCLICGKVSNDFMNCEQVLHNKSSTGYYFCKPDLMDTDYSSSQTFKMIHLDF